MMELTPRTLTLRLVLVVVIASQLFFEFQFLAEITCGTSKTELTNSRLHYPRSSGTTSKPTEHTTGVAQMSHQTKFTIFPDTTTTSAITITAAPVATRYDSTITQSSIIATSSPSPTVDVFGTEAEPPELSTRNTRPAKSSTVSIATTLTANSKGQANAKIKRSSERSVSLALEKFETDLQRLNTANKRKVSSVDTMGKLCFIGDVRDLNQLLRVFMKLIHLGQQLQRVVILPPYLFSLYDPFLMNFKNVKLSTNQGFCDPRGNMPNVTIWREQWPVVQKWPEELKAKDDMILYLSGLDLEAHTSTMYDSKDQERSIMRQVFSNIFPYKETRETVQEFISQHFGTDPFVAVRLDWCDPVAIKEKATNQPNALMKWFEGKIGKIGESEEGVWCAETDLSLLRWMLERNAPELVDAPVFVSMTEKFRAEHPEIIELFLESEDLYAVTFEGECPRHDECDMISREIIARSAFFYSARETSTVTFMDNLRVFRRNGESVVRTPALFQNFASEDLSKQGWQPSKLSGLRIREEDEEHVEENNEDEDGEEPSHYQKYLAKLDETILRVKSVKPVAKQSPRGVICQLGLFEQLNNVLDQVAALLHIGYSLRRTVVVPPLVSELYGFSTLESEWQFRSRRRQRRNKLPFGDPPPPPSYPRISHDLSLCDPKRGWFYAPSIPNEGVDLYIRRMRRIRAPVLAMGAKDAFHYGFGDRSMFKYLQPHRETREIVINFVEKNFGNRPFVAVHLRFLDGTCYDVSNGDPACDLDPVLLRQILKVNAPRLVNAPIFVASDHQRPDLELLFMQAGAVFYRGACHSFDKQCMVIDAEIATRSAYFYGLHLSTAAQNIERARRQRKNGTPFRQLDAFPQLNSSSPAHLFGGEGIWKPHSWSRDMSPKEWFASRPREDMNLMAATLAPKVMTTRKTKTKTKLKRKRRARGYLEQVVEYVDNEEEQEEGEEGDTKRRRLGRVVRVRDMGMEQGRVGDDAMFVPGGAKEEGENEQERRFDPRLIKRLNCHEKFEMWSNFVFWFLLVLVLLLPSTQQCSRVMSKWTAGDGNAGGIFPGRMKQANRGL